MRMICIAHILIGLDPKKIQEAKRVIIVKFKFQFIPLTFPKQFKLLSLKTGNKITYNWIEVAKKYSETFYFLNLIWSGGCEM